MPPRSRFRRVNSVHSIKHIVDDFNKGGIKDPQVHNLAAKERRIIVTFNIKDFRSLATKTKSAGVIGLSPNLSYEQADSKLNSFLNRSRPSDIYGKFITIN